MFIFSRGLWTYYGRPDAGDRHFLLSFTIKVYCHALRQYAHADLACEKQLVDFVPADVEFCIPIAYAVLPRKKRE
jgi:hypothetical protein